MTNLCSTDKLPSLLSLLFLHDFLSICFYLISHPLVPTYLLLLSPFIVKVLFFIYPLFFSTFLLSLTLSFHFHDLPSSIPPEFPAVNCSSVLRFLRDELVHDEARDNLITEQLFSILFADLQLLSYQMESSEDSSSGNEGKREKLSEEKWKKRNASIVSASGLLQRKGSLKKEKEWKRTLACKLFEERMTYRLCQEREADEGVEGMDLLWEAYEVEAHMNDKKLGRKEKKAKKAKKAGKKIAGEDEQDEGMPERLCCLQALKFSAGKMKLGVGRPSLVKITMALNGLSLLHRDGRRRKNT